MRSVGGKWKLVGLVSLGEEHKSMTTIIAGYYSLTLHQYFHMQRIKYFLKVFNLIGDKSVLPDNVHKSLYIDISLTHITRSYFL